MRKVASACLVTAACAGSFSRPVHVVIYGTDAPGGSTTLTLPGYERTRIVDALSVTESGPKIGGTHAVALTTAPNTSGKVKVDVNGQRDAIGAQWQAGTGLAAFVAARTLDADLLDFAFSAETAGQIDGPSASGLMTAAFLATLTGVDVERDAAMTGTINPDGTIGPVGGIPEKFAAAIAAGKRHLGFPVGMRLAKSEATGATVDLVKLAADRGAEAVELKNVRDAYHLMTRKDLPRVVPATVDDMRLDATASAKLLELTAARQQSMAQRWTVIVQLDKDPQAHAAVRRLAARALDDLAASDRLRAKGLAAGAHAAMTNAWVHALEASALHAIATAAATGNSAGAIATLDALIALGGTDRAAFDAIAATPTLTLADQLRTMQADGEALRGWNELVWVGPRLATLKDLLRKPHDGATDVEAIVRAAELPVSTLCMRASYFATAKDWLELAPEPGGGQGAPPAGITRTATAYQAASAAAIAYFDRLAIAVVAQHEKRSELAIKQEIAEVDASYLFAHVADHPRTETLLANLERAWGSASPSWGLLSLASAELGYTMSSALIEEDVSLQVHGDQIEPADAFAAMLDAAEESARESAHAARVATGAVPTPAKIAYGLATWQRKGGGRNKLNALREYWSSSLYSQTAVMLAAHH